MSGTVKARIRLGTRIAPIATGEGAVWVASFAGTIYRISPAKNAVTGRVRMGPAPNIVAGLGALWVAQGKHLFKLDTSTLKTLDGVSIEQPVGAAPLGDSAPAIWDNSVWVPHSFSKVSRVDGRTLDAQEQQVGFGPRLTSSAGALWIGTYDAAEQKGAVTRLLHDGKTELVATGAWNIKHLAVSRTSIWIRTAADSLVEVDRESGAVREFKVRDEGYPGEINVAFGFLSLANSALGELWLIPQDLT